MAEKTTLYTPDQRSEIQEGKKKGLNTTVYEDPKFLAIQMREIRLALEKGLDVSVLRNPELDWLQMEEIRLGLESRVDVSRYARPDITFHAMRQIRKGMECGIDVSDFLEYPPMIVRQIRKSRRDNVDIMKYVAEGYKDDQLEQIRISLTRKVPIEDYLNVEFRAPSIEEFRIGLEKGLDITPYVSTSYEWRQMREIRLGLEKRIDISLYSNPLFLAPQMKEIRLGIEEGLDVSSYAALRFSATDMKRKRLALREEVQKAAQISASSESLDFEKLDKLLEIDDVQEKGVPFKIVISPDGMEAYLSIADKNNRPTEEEVLGEVWNCKIRKGILRNEIRNATDGTYEEDTVLIAVGQNAQNGKDGWYEYFFNTNVNRKPKLLPDGSVDYQDIEWYDAVKKGDKIAYYHKAEDGIDGYDVEGNILKSTRGREQTVLSGSGFVMDKDRCTYTAKTDGMVRLDGDRLEVSEMLEIEEVNTAIGNVLFEGSIRIKGNVGTGVVVKSGKDIIIDGFVEGATLEAEGEIILRKGINGAGRGKINAKGSVTAKFIESADVYAGGIIHIDYSMNSVLYSEEIVEAKQRNGTIVGGVCTGVKGVNAQNIGSKAGKQTVIRAGSSSALLKLNNEIYRQLTAAQEEIRILDNVRKEMEGKLSVEQLAEQPVYEKVQNALYSKSKEFEELSAKQEEVRGKLLELNRAVIFAKGTIYDGVKVQLGNANWVSDKELSDVTLRKVRKGSEEKVFVYHNNKDPKDPDALVE
ncbi:MAG: FapA family protein [Lachnospiraceae bacterium]|nr:FapA family protein [Lachnospiraceae bacterium]